MPIYNSGSCHYLAHHGVKKDSQTIPLRIVYDCSAKSSTTMPSLNDCLYTGPSMVADLANVLLRFWVHQYALVSDIDKPFLMLKLHDDDCDYTRFLWPEQPLNPTSPLKCYRFKVVLFSDTCSQFLLNETIKKHLSIVDADMTNVEGIKSGLYIANLQETANGRMTLIAQYWDAQKIVAQAHYACANGPPKTSNCKNSWRWMV